MKLSIRKRPPQAYESLFKAGVADVFGPGSVIPICAQKILAALAGNIHS
jgi:methylmalonyl-CoA mutase cobalamin-binding subunit